MQHKIALAIHGGAGVINKQQLSGDLYKQYEAALHQALERGYNILQNNGTSMDAVEAAVIELEDCPFFNAGRGAVFNSEGKHEMDASIMDGSNLRAGAVAGVSNVKNPIKLARMVMEQSHFVLLSGQGANEFAKLHKLPMEEDAYFYNEFRYKEWQAKKQDPSQKKYGTVGAVALDSRGNLAAATSTGGLTDKRFGRVGDSPIIGAGTYANNETCAVSCTGDGEFFIRSVVAYDVSCQIAYRNQSLEQAVAATMQNIHKIEGAGGLIAIDKQGKIQMPFNTEGMYRGCVYDNGEIEVKIFE